MTLQGGQRILQAPGRPADAIGMGANDDPLVMQVITRLNVGGPARLVLGTHRRLAAHGFRSLLVHGQLGPGEAEMPLVGPVTRIPELGRPIRPVSDLRARRSLARVTRSQRPDVVHTHMAKAGALGRVTTLPTHPVVVHTFHGHVLQHYFSRLRNEAFARAERHLARRTDALVAVSPSVRDALLGLGIGAPERWHVIPIGIDLSTVRARRSPREARALLGLPSAGPLIGCVGRFVAIKDHETLFRAAQLLLERHPGATLVLAGDGEQRSRIEARARGLLGDRVRLLGWVDDLASLYAALDVVVLTSRLEGAPVALLEAQAAGLPVVATDVGGVRDVVRHGETGLLVPAGSHLAVAEALRTLLDAPEQARALGGAGAGWVRERFSEERMVQDLAALYRELLARRGAAGPQRGDATEPGVAKVRGTLERA